MNEPAGVGFPKTDDGAEKAMGIYNAAAQAIRDVDPARPILIGPAGFNEPKYLTFVTEKYLTYKFGGKGFTTDPNVGVAIHFYEPHWPIAFAQFSTPLGNNDTKWQNMILEQISYALNWRKQIGVNIPIITTEWGCWMFKSRTESGDLEKWADYTMNLFKTHDIGNVWYTGIVDNQYAWSIFDTEYGWNPIILEKLTGAKVTSWPAINQAINGEFLSVDHGWNVSTPQLEKAVQRKWDEPAAYSGNQMLKLTVPEKLTAGGQLYLQTFVDKMALNEATRTLLHLIEGITYTISFIAGTDDGQKGAFTVKLRDAKTQSVIQEFIEIQVSGSAPQASALQYKHNAATVDDVRLEFEVGSKAQVLYLDKVEFIRESTAPPALVVV